MSYGADPVTTTTATVTVAGTSVVATAAPPYNCYAIGVSNRSNAPGLFSTTEGAGDPLVLGTNAILLAPNGKTILVIGTQIDRDDSIPVYSAVTLAGFPMVFDIEYYNDMGDLSPMSNVGSVTFVPFSDSGDATPTTVRTSAALTGSAVATTGLYTGNSKWFVLEVNITDLNGGTLTGLTVGWEGSEDGTNWSTIFFEETDPTTGASTLRAYTQTTAATAIGRYVFRCERVMQYTRATILAAFATAGPLATATARRIS